MARRWTRRTTAGCALVAMLAVGGGCGGDAESAEAVEQRIARERADAARLARQDERIKQLEQERSRRREASRGDRVVTVTPPPPSPAPAPAPSSSGGRVSGVITQLGSFRNRSGAESEASRLRGRGIDANVLLSDEYQELRNGYWVVYAGPYGSYDAANAVAARSGVPGAKARPVTPTT